MENFRVSSDRIFFGVRESAKIRHAWEFYFASDYVLTLLQFFTLSSNWRRLSVQPKCFGYFREN